MAPWWRWLLCLLLTLITGLPAAAQDEVPGSVVVGDQVVLTLRTSVGGITPEERALIVNRRLQRVLTNPELRPELVRTEEQPTGTVRILIGPLNLLEVTPEDAEAKGSPLPNLAREWSLRLRDALAAAKPLQNAAEDRPHSRFLPLLLVSALAFLVPLGLSRFRKVRVPIVVGEILVGILVGRSGLQLIHHDSWLEFLAEFGFAYLMFLSGLEVDFSLLSGAVRNGDRKAANPLRIAGLTFGLTLLLAGAVAFGLTAAGLIRQPWMMLLVLSTTSLGMVVPILKERGMTGTSFGQTILVAALVADFATMLLITMVAGWISSGPTLRLFLSLLLVGVFVGFLRLGQVLTRSSGLLHALRELSHATAQIQVRGSLALMLIFVALSEQLGTEVILGAFLAGVLLSLFTQEGGAEVRHKLEALGFGFFIPIFFIMVGVRFDVRALFAQPEGWMLAVLMVLGAFVIKLGAALPFRAMASGRETLAAGFLLSSRLSLIIAAAEIGLRLGLFSETVRAAAICVALVTCMAGPFGFQFLMPGTTSRPHPDPEEALALH